MDPRLTHEAFAYEFTDIPPGMSIDDYRRERGMKRRAESNRSGACDRGSGSHRAGQVADPFRPTAEPQQLRELRAAQLLGCAPRRWRPFARWRAARTGAKPRAAER